MMMMEGETAIDEKDMFREIPLRYLGYTNELGEAFRHMVPLRLVHLSYLVSSAYVLSHAVSQGRRAHRTHNLSLEQSPAHHYHHPDSTSHHTGIKMKPTVVFMDTLLWQGLASVLIPGVVINRLCVGCRVVLSRNRHLLSPGTRRWAVTVIGIAAIPLIIHPIDSVVDKFMDSFVRPLCLKIK